jgi:hypothetical protein
VLYDSNSRRDFGLEIGFSDHFNTRLVTTHNYSAIPDLHTLQIPRAHRLLFSAALLPLKGFAIPIGEETGWATEPVWTQWRRKKNILEV